MARDACARNPAGSIERARQNQSLFCALRLFGLPLFLPILYGNPAQASRRLHSKLLGRILQNIVQNSIYPVLIILQRLIHEDIRRQRRIIVLRPVIDAFAGRYGPGYALMWRGVVATSAEHSVGRFPRRSTDQCDAFAKAPQETRSTSASINGTSFFMICFIGIPSFLIC